MAIFMKVKRNEWMDPSGCPYKVLQGDSDKGRMCVASRCLTPGDIVLAEQAAACVAAPRRSLCDDCLAHIDADESRGEVPRQCVNCRSLFGLRGSCSISSHLDSSSASAVDTRTRGLPPPAVRLSAKILFRRFSGRLGHEQVSRIDTLMHEEDQRHLPDARQTDCSTNNSNGDSGSSSSSLGRKWSEQDEDDCIQVAKLAAGMAHGAAVAGTAGDLPLLVSDGLGKKASLLDLARKELRRVCINAISTCDGSGATGLGLCPSGAMFNHSCTPNCQAWWRGSKLEIRCTKPVAEGEELCFSYIHIDQSSALRQAQLRQSWFFTCRCRRCASQEWDAELIGLRCTAVAMCSGAVSPPRSSDGKSQSGDVGGGGRGAFCNRCGSNAFVGARSARSAHSTPYAGWAPNHPENGPHGIRTATVGSPSWGVDPTTWHPRTHEGRQKRGDFSAAEKAGTPTTGSTCSEQGQISIDKRCRDGGDEARRRLLAEADRRFEDGVGAYMREDPEVALVALEKSLLVREKFLHPFNKALLRTLRYGSMAAIATCSWEKAHSFLSRWLHPMDTMFGAAEVWDIAAMRIDNGLVLEQLTATSTNVSGAIPEIPGTVPETVPRMAPPSTPELVETSLQGRMPPSGRPEAAAAGSLHPAAYRELVEGLRCLWICLGRDTGLPAETAALQVCSEYGINL